MRPNLTNHETFERMDRILGEGDLSNPKAKNRRKSLSVLVFLQKTSPTADHPQDDHRTADPHGRSLRFETSGVQQGEKSFNESKICIHVSSFFLSASYSSKQRPVPLSTGEPKSMVGASFSFLRSTTRQSLCRSGQGRRNNGTPTSLLLRLDRRCTMTTASSSASTTPKEKQQRHQQQQPGWFLRRMAPPPGGTELPDKTFLAVAAVVCGAGYYAWFIEPPKQQQQQQASAAAADADVVNETKASSPSEDKEKAKTAND